MDQRHVATCANHCWQQLPWHARHVGDDDDDDDDGGDDDCVAPVMGNETDMDVGCGMRTCRMDGMGRGTAERGTWAWLRLFHILNATLTMSLIGL